MPRWGSVYTSVETRGAELARLSSPARRSWRFADDAGELGGDDEGRARAGRFGRSGRFGFEPGDNVGDREGLVEPVHDEADVTAAVFVDGAVQFVPQRMARRDAEIAADIGEDGADRLTPDLGRDLLWGGQVGEAGIRVGGLLRLGAPRGRWLGLAREGAGRAGGWRGFRLGFGVEAGGGAGDLFLEQTGAQQALGDAGEDQGEVAGAEGARDVGGVVGDGALAERVGELLAVVDELADEREQTAGAA